MTKVLLTGGSGFIAAHVLEQLLAKHHHVVATVRSEEKGRRIRDAYPDEKQTLETVVVPDIGRPDAFDEVVGIPGLEAVLHVASPFDPEVQDLKTEIVEPAVSGTVGLLRAVARSAPSVRRVVITSSFVAIMDPSKLDDPETVFTESSWNPVELDGVRDSPQVAYFASKTLAEKAAWDFVGDASNGAKFDLVTVNPPYVIGPAVHYLASLDAINSSNAPIVDAVTGKWKREGAAPQNPVPNWIDVRDVAAVHVKVLDMPEAGGRRLLTTEGLIFPRDISAAVRKNFPEYADRLPPDDGEGDSRPAADERYKYDSSATDRLLRVKWTPFESSVVDLVNSLKSLGM